MRKSAYALSALLTCTGALHFIVPDIFAKIVPPQLGNATFWVYASGVGELIGAATVAHPRTRKWGARWCALLFVLVFPGNVYMAVSDTTDVPKWISWARLPLQIPLIWWALRISRNTP